MGCLSLAAVREQFAAKFVGVELLTLSACNTAMTAGNKSNGLEVEGFGALAQRQGAKSVLATLWAVADSSTRDLMSGFYRILETDAKVSKAEALRRAQIALIRGNYQPAQITENRRSESVRFGASANNFPKFVKDENAPFAHPFYWSPFVLIGNWR
ncbi:MAG: CHAT domain-containing protein [Pyrinomonadaceae bacterium]|nr:CHAT domain-containing protein [Pyrinomonadaceae bacterium]